MQDQSNNNLRTASRQYIRKHESEEEHDRTTLIRRRTPIRDFVNWIDEAHGVARVHELRSGHVTAYCEGLPTNGSQEGVEWWVDPLREFIKWLSEKDDSRDSLHFPEEIIEGHE